MIGVQDVAHVDRLLLGLTRFFAIDEIKEVGGFAKGGVGLWKRLALSGKMEVGGDDRHLCNEFDGSSGLILDRILSFRWLVTGERGDDSADGTHR